VNILFECNHWTTPDDVEAFARRAATLGATGLCLPVGDSIQSKPDEPAARAMAIRAEKAGVPIRCLHVVEPFPLTLIHADRRDTSQLRGAVCDCIHRANWLGATTLIISFIAPATATGAERHSTLIDHLLYLRFEAQRHGVRLAVEAHRDGMLTSLMETYSALDRANSPWIGASIEIDRLEKPAEWIETLTHRLAVIRVDHPSAMNPTTELRTTLDRTHFNGVVTVMPDTSRDLTL
jgi:sugar phosphate isomerase/epimerase